MLETSIVAVAALLIGYILGKHNGYQSGFLTGQTTMRLLLRQKSLEQGFCLLCYQLLREHAGEAGIKQDCPANNNLQGGL